jgi:hypothetical protein
MSGCDAEMNVKLIFFQVAEQSHVTGFKLWKRG